MALLYLLVLGVLGSAFTALGFLMMLVPRRYPKLYEVFLSRRERNERDRMLDTRVQGLISFVVGAMFLIFVWAWPSAS
jgi:sterol desaturase/sphingolipid hydroxylase (fatty acid hydroxylase superfamily)